MHPDGPAAGVGGRRSGRRGSGEQPAGRHLPAAPLPAGAERSPLPERHAPDPDPDHLTGPQRSAEPPLAAHPGQP